MKKLLLSAGAMLFTLATANAQLTATSVTEDFSSSPVLFWYSGAASAPNGTATTGQISFQYTDNTNMGAFLSADFGNDGATPTPNPNTVDLSSMADFEMDIENSGSVDAILRVYLKDVNNNTLEVEPNISDCAAAGTDFGYVTPGLTWTTEQMVYPTPGDLNAVYPRVAYNGFVLQSNTRKTVRIDLSSVAGTVGGRYTNYTWGSTVATSPNSGTASSNGFDITKVHVVEFHFNENVSWNLSGGAVDKQSYKYDITDAPTQGDGSNGYTGTLVFRSMKIGSVLAPLPDVFTTAVTSSTSSTSTLSVFPNPAKESLTVSFTANNGADISLSNMSGHKVLSTSVAAGENQTTLNTSGLSNGIYILNVATENGTEARKVVIQ